MIEPAIEEGEKESITFRVIGIKMKYIGVTKSDEVEPFKYVGHYENDWSLYKDGDVVHKDIFTRYTKVPFEFAHDVTVSVD